MWTDPITNPLHRARAARSISRSRAAQVLGVHRQTLTRWEHADFDPSKLPLATLEALCKLYVADSVAALLEARP